jgi:hypothetical protein
LPVSRIDCTGPESASESFFCNVQWWSAKHEDGTI